MGARPTPLLSVEEYLIRDLEAEFKSEYHDGVLYPIIAASMEHGIISVNVSRRLAEKLENTPCRAVGSPVRVRVSPTRFVYPDLMVICGKPLMTAESSDTITNPKVIVEILSPATEGYDYAGKFDSYRLLPSFEEYVLIAQDRPKVHVFRRMPDDRWLLTPYEGPNRTAAIESLGIALPLHEIYAGIEFHSPVTAAPPPNY